MKFFETALHGVWKIELDLREDERGWFARAFCVEEFKKAGIDFTVVQANRSFTKQKGMLRGLHYQSEPTWEPKVCPMHPGDDVPGHCRSAERFADL